MSDDRQVRRRWGGRVRWLGWFADPGGGPLRSRWRRPCPVEVAESVGQPGLVVWGCTNVAQVCFDLGGWSEGRAARRRARGVAPDEDSPRMRGLEACLLGKHELALESFREAVADFRRRGDAPHLVMTLAHLTDWLLQLGRSGEAESFGREAIEHAPVRWNG